MGYFLIVCLFLGLISCSKNSDVTKIKIGAVSKGNSINEQSVDEVLTLNGATASQIVLSNNLRVTLISSPTSKKAAASVAIKVGHEDNPIESQGLAHYLEHMLFLGTKEFPIVGSYKKFLSENNGKSNAYTSTNHTNYFLEVRPDKFNEAIHRLSRFFVSPKFYSENIEQEKEAVHNEFNFRFETFKPFRVFNAFKKEGSNGRLFFIGNKESLAKVTVQETRAFFKEHYYTEAMHVILAGPQTLKELKFLVKKYFLDLKSNPRKALNKYDKFLDLDFNELPAKVNLKPQGAKKMLSVFIPVLKPKKINPNLISMMGSLIGDEGKESLMAFLKGKGLVRNSKGALSGGINASTAWITLELTDKGVKEQKKVLSYIKGYLEFLKKEGLLEYLNGELAQLNKVSKISKSFYEIKGKTLQDLNREYMKGETFPQTMYELFFKEPLVDVTNEEYINFLDSLSWDKVLVIFMHPENEEIAYKHEYLENIKIGGLKIQDISGQRVVTDSLYKFAYSVETLSVNKIKPRGRFKLKKKNIYIPEKFDLYIKNQPPIYTKNTKDWGSIFYSSLVATNLPKAYVDLSLFSDQIDLTLKEDVISLYILKELLTWQTTDTTYDMVLADFQMSFLINTLNGALDISFYGWSDTFIKAFSHMVGFTNITPLVQDFESVKELYRQNIELEEAGEVSSIGVRQMRAQIEYARLSYEDIRIALDNVNYTKFMNFVHRFKSGLHIRGALSGNIKTNYVDDLVLKIQKQWSPTWSVSKNWSKLYKTDSIMGSKNLEGRLPLFETSIVGNHPYEVFYYGYWNFGQAFDEKEKLISKILGDWLAPDYYTELRTNRGLAYSLGAWGFEHMDNIGVAVYLQSSTYTVDQVEAQVDEYLQTWAKEILPNKTQELLERTKASYLLQRKAPFEAKAIHTRYVRFVNLGYESIDEDEKVLAPLSEITLEEVISYGKKNLLNKKKVGSFVKVSRKLD